MDRARVFRRLRGSGLTGSTGLFVFCLALALVFLVRVPFFGFPALKYIKVLSQPFHSNLPGPFATPSRPAAPLSQCVTQWPKGVLSMLILLIVLLYFLLKHAQEYPRPEVRLDYATYKGLTLHHNVNQYLGMRFAAPPLDDLRWRAPRDPPEEMDIQDASEVCTPLLRCTSKLANMVFRARFQFGPTCLGTNHNSYFGNEDEDCLFVNVWAPKDANETTKLPVWVFIQGGGMHHWLPRLIPLSLCSGKDSLANADG